MQIGYSGLFTKMKKNKRTSLVQAEMGQLMHHDEQELLSLWEQMVLG